MRVLFLLKTDVPSSIESISSICSCVISSVLQLFMKSSILLKYFLHSILLIKSQSVKSSVLFSVNIINDFTGCSFCPNKNLSFLLSYNLIDLLNLFLISLQ